MGEASRRRLYFSVVLNIALIVVLTWGYRSALHRVVRKSIAAVHAMVGETVNPPAKLYSSIKASSGVTVVPVDDPNISYSGSWYRQGSAFAQTSNAGQDIYVSFRKVSSITAHFDLTPLIDGRVVSAHFPQIVYSVNGGPWSVESPVATERILATGLDPADVNSIRLMTLEFGAEDRWTPANTVRLIGFTVSAGGITVPAIGVPTGGDEIHFADSIGEGTRTLGIGVSAFDHDVRFSPPTAWCAATGTRCDNVGFGGQGIAIAGASGVPAITSAWDHLDADHSRLANGKFIRQPKAIHLWLGANDYIFHVDPDNVQAGVTQMCRNLRGACTSGIVPIFWHIPFSGGQRAAITAGVAEANDPNCFVIDGGEADQVGLAGTALAPPGTLQSSDAIHPNGFTVAGLTAHHVAIYSAMRGRRP